MPPRNECYILKPGRKAFRAALLESPERIGVLSSSLGWKVFGEFSEPACPIDVARKLGVHEQKVYYYVKKFREAGMLEEVKREARHGTTARFYRVTSHAFAFKLPNAPAKSIDKAAVPGSELEPFITGRRFNARIVVGSPDPHGPWKARGSDSCCAIDFALFMGAFTSAKDVPNYMLDVEVRDSHLRENLILFGGPAVNVITAKVNDRLPVFIDTNNHFDIKSRVSGKVYKDDETGLIAMIENPWNRKARVLVLAGKRFPGTRSSVLAWIKSPKNVLRGNRFDRSVKARVVRGYDLDGDGVIDSAEIME